MGGPDTPPSLHKHRQLRIEQSPLERGRLWVEILAFVAAGLWAVYTFVYQTHIAPLLQPAHELVTGEVSRIGAGRNSYIERVQVTLLNNGPKAIDTAGIAITLYGLQGVKSQPTERKVQNQTVQIATGIPDRWTVLATYGQLFEAATQQTHNHVILEPADSVRPEFITTVSRRYSALRLRVDTVYVGYPTNAKVPLQLHRLPDRSLVLEGNVRQAGGLEANWDWYFSL